MRMTIDLPDDLYRQATSIARAPAGPGAVFGLTAQAILRGMARPAATPKPAIPSKPDPKGTRAGLPPEEVAPFDERLRAAMAEATENLDLVPVMEVLDHYHRL